MRVAIWPGFSMYHLGFQECHQRLQVCETMSLPRLDVFQTASPHRGLSGPGRAFLP